MNTEKSSVSPENNPDKSTADSAAAAGRSYDCNFCKRGFTNAQALGGHMNIHRKDKGKGKHRNHHQEFGQPSIGSNYRSLRYLAEISSLSQHRRRWEVPDLLSGGRQVSNRIYLPYLENPNSQIGNYSVWRADQSAVDANYSLRIGPVGDGNVKECEVDLELRLGYERQ